MVLVVLVIQIVIKVIGTGAKVIVIGTNHNAVVICGHNADTLFTENAIDGVELLFTDADILEHSLDIVFGNTTVLSTLEKKRGDLRFDLVPHALSLIWHRFSLHSTQDTLL